MMKLQLCVVLCTLASIVQGRPRTFNVQSGGGRIIQGTAAASCPYIVYFQACSSNGCWSCGASIINADYIITAAHCATDTSPITSASIRAGSLKASTGGQTRSISNIWVYPGYNQATNGGVDIAVCRLATSLTLSSTVQPIPLATQAPQVGDMLRITGWGGTVPYADGQTVNQVTSDTLLEAQVPVSRVSQMVIYTGFVTATGVVADTCQGDSGGPLALASASSPVGYVLVATVSSGPGCGQGGTESLNMNVASYVATIMAQAGALVPTPSRSRSASRSRSRSPSPKAAGPSGSPGRSASPQSASPTRSTSPSPKAPSSSSSPKAPSSSSSPKVLAASPSQRASATPRPSPISPRASPSPRSNVDICGPETVLNVSSTPGILFRGPYGFNEYCYMKLQAPAGRTIVINILSLSTESGFDFVDFYNMDSAGVFSWFYSASGAGPLTQLSSSTNTVWVDWSSDAGVNGAGWMISFTLAAASRSQISGTGATDAAPLSPIGGTAADLDARRFIIEDVDVQPSTSSMTSVLFVSMSLLAVVVVGLVYRSTRRMYTIQGSDGDSQLMIEMPIAAPLCMYVDPFSPPAPTSPLVNFDAPVCINEEEVAV